MDYLNFALLVVIIILIGVLFEEITKSKKKTLETSGVFLNSDNGFGKTEYLEFARLQERVKELEKIISETKKINKTNKRIR